MPVKELHLIYSDHIRSAFEVYEAGNKKLLGHITFRLENDIPGEYCYTPFGQKKGDCYPTIIAALTAFFKTNIRLHFPVTKDEITGRAMKN